MSRTRWWTAVGIVGVLAVAAGLLVWRDRPTTATTTTTLLAAPTTTTTIASTTTAVVTSTTSAEQRIEEVEAILSDLWFGWLDAIYRKDADALWEVVATTPQHDAGVSAMETVEFLAPPDSRRHHQSRWTKILLDREDCLVTYSTTQVSFMSGDNVRSGR